MTIFLYVLLGITIFVSQMGFMFSPMYGNAQGIGQNAFFISIGMIVPIVYSGGWIHILWFIAFYAVVYFISLKVSGAIWRYVIKKYF